MRGDLVVVAKYNVNRIELKEIKQDSEDTGSKEGNLSSCFFLGFLVTYSNTTSDRNGENKVKVHVS